MAENEEGADDISCLPDEILFRITSFLPFESAIQTTFLSTRWRRLWNTALVQCGPTHDITSSVFDFLSNFQENSPTKNIRKLVYRFNRGGILLATIGPKDKLRLDFSDGKQGLSTQFGLRLNLNRQEHIHQNTTPYTFVKSLELVSVSSLCNEAVSSMVSGFMFLENMKITKCTGLMSLRVNSNIKLKHLTILDCLELKDLYIGCPKLKTFRYRGPLPWYRSRSHHNLDDAMLDCRQGLGDRSMKSSDFDPMLLTIKNVEILTLCKWTFEALICPALSCLKAGFQFYRLKELWWIDNSTPGSFSCDSLISFLKLCPSLEQLFVTMGPTSYRRTSRAISCPSQVGKQTKLAHLKIVVLEGFTNEADEIIIKFSECLKELVSVDPQILAVSGGQQSLGTKPQLQDSKWCYKFVVGGNDNTELPPKHAHMCV